MTPIEAAEAALPERDNAKPAEQQGLFRKFTVTRTDGSSEPGGKHHGCEYFVLDVDHDPHAAAALAAYADAVEPTHPLLAADMRRRYGLAALRAALPALRGDAESVNRRVAAIAADRDFWREKVHELEALREVPAVCDGKEQDAFEAWARSERYDMQTHPLHWLFLDAKTYAARQGWKAALHYVAQQTAAAPPAPSVREVEPVALPCKTYETTSGDHTVCQTCGETWRTGMANACLSAAGVLRKAAPPAPAQPAQGGGVVAWYDGSKFYGSRDAASMDCADMAALRPVYLAPAAPDEPGAGVVEAPAPSTDPLRKFRGTQAFLEGCWRSANSNIGVDRDDVALAIRTLQEGLDEASAALAAQTDGRTE